MNKITLAKLNSLEESFRGRFENNSLAAAQSTDNTSDLILQSSMSRVVTGAVKAMQEHPNGKTPVGMAAVILNILALGIQWGVTIGESDQLEYMGVQSKYEN